MSLSAVVNNAIKTARQGLGDLVQSATLRIITNRVYDTSKGEYVNTTEDRSVEVVKDTFTFHEQQLEDYRQTDIKLVLFNPNNDLEPTISHCLVMNGVEYPIIKAEPAYAGGFRPVWTLVLRK